MRAAVYTEHGAARDVLAIVDLPDPSPGPGDVRVRLHRSGVNPTDWKSRAVGPPLARPQIPNQDGAGVIDAVGDGVSSDRLGERVWVYHAAWQRPGGTAAQYTCLPAARAVRLPDGASFDQGAGLGIPFITAHRCLLADGPIEGRTVLVSGGAGAVGNAAIQLARHLGAGSVISTVSSPEKARLAEAAGADVVLNYRDGGFRDALAAAAPDGVDRIVEVAIWDNLDTDLDVLAPHGAIASYASSDTDPVVPVRRLMTANATLRFVLVYHLTQPMLDHAVSDITAALETGALRPLPEHHFHLEEIAAAHEAVEHGAVGKVLVDLPD